MATTERVHLVFCSVNLHIFLSSEDNPALTLPMLNFTQTGYHKSAEAAAFGRIFGRGKIIILEAGVRCGASLDSLYMETQ